MFCCKGLAENEAGRSVPDLFLFSKKALNLREKQVVCIYIYILIGLNLAYDKNKLHKKLGY